MSCFCVGTGGGRGRVDAEQRSQMASKLYSLPSFVLYAMFIPATVKESQGSEAKVRFEVKQAAKVKPSKLAGPGGKSRRVVYAGS